MPAPNYIPAGISVVTYHHTITDDAGLETVNAIRLVPEDSVKDWEGTFARYTELVPKARWVPGFAYTTTKPIPDVGKRGIFCVPPSYDWLTVDDMVALGYLIPNA